MAEIELVNIVTLVQF